MASDVPSAASGGAVPDLQARTVGGVFDRVEQAEAAVQALQAAGYPAGDLSLVRKPAGSPAELGAEDTRAGEGMVAGISAGTVLGGAAGLAALAIPGIGPLLAAGPIVAILTGAVSGGALGGLVGSFAGLGIPTEQARDYEAAVRAGGVVVTVRTADQSAADRAASILSQHGAREATSFTPAL